MLRPWSFFVPENARIYELGGSEAIDLLQRISTADLASVRQGKGVATILTNEKGRVVDIVGVSVSAEGRVLVAALGDRDGRVGRWLERFIIMEDVVVRDVSGRFSQAICYAINDHTGTWDHPSVVPPFIAMSFTAWKNRWTLLAIESTDRDQTAALLQETGGLSVGRAAFDGHRVAAGVPWTGNEISDQRNPLESRMRSLISFTKGCYIGQEVIARLDTYRKVQMVLTRFSGTLPNGTIVPMPIYTTEGEEAGFLSTTADVVSGHAVALGFVRTHLLQSSVRFQCAGHGEVWVLDAVPDDGIYQGAA